MSNRTRRFAGAKLAAMPVDVITEDLQEALFNLQQKNLAMKVADRPDYVKTTKKVPKRNGDDLAELTFWADPEPFDPREFKVPGLSEANEIGNLADIQRIVDAQPHSIYDMSWEVNGEYGAADQFSRRQKMQIARAAQEEWDRIIPTMPEGQLVGNHPFGVTEGDYGRADVYMNYGFGPVQPDMNQYGIIHNGRIEPISPMGPNVEYAKHLAERAHAGGQLDFENELNQNISNLNQGLFKDLSNHKQRGASEWFRGEVAENNGAAPVDNRREQEPLSVRFAGADDAIGQIQEQLRVFRNQGPNMDTFIAQEHIRPQPYMRGRDALEVLRKENNDPGSAGANELAQALVNLNQIQERGFGAVRSALS